MHMYFPMSSVFQLQTLVTINKEMLISDRRFYMIFHIKYISLCLVNCYLPDNFEQKM